MAKSQLMSCFGCGARDLVIARVNAQLQGEERILIWCKPCKAALMSPHWSALLHMTVELADSRKVHCVGCNKTIPRHMPGHLCDSIPRTMIFCGRCTYLLQGPGRWEDMTRAGEGHVDYQPSVIIKGEIRGGH